MIMAAERIFGEDGKFQRRLILSYALNAYDNSNLLLGIFHLREPTHNIYLDLTWVNLSMLSAQPACFKKWLCFVLHSQYWWRETLSWRKCWNKVLTQQLKESLAGKKSLQYLKKIWWRYLSWASSRKMCFWKYHLENVS